MKNYLYQIFLETKELLAKGEDVIELNIGDPDEKTSASIIEALQGALKKGEIHYTGATGSAELKELLQKRYQEFKKDRHEIVVSMGSRIILAAVIEVLLANKEDILLINSPYYPSFVHLADFQPGQKMIIDTLADFQLDLERIEKICSKQKIKAIVVNSPNNPTGVVYKKEDLIKLSDMATKYDFYILSDECYLDFSCSPLESLHNLNPQKTIVVDSFSKRFAMCGWRLGWGLLPKELADAVKHYLSVKISSLSPFVEIAGKEALRGNLIYDYQEERQIANNWAKKMGLGLIESTGAFYIFPNFEKYIAKGKNSGDLALEILAKSKVALAPGLAFGNYPKHLRLAFCLRKPRLEEALDRLEKFL